MSRVAPILALLVVACEPEITTAPWHQAVEPDPPRPATVFVTPETADLTALGATVTLTAAVRDQNGQAMPSAAVSWSSSDPRVVAVDGEGLATAMGLGTATVTATAGTVSATATVAVAQVVASVKVTPAAGTVVEADTLRLAAVAADANGHAVNDAVFAWASNDTTVAVIDDLGLVTGVAPGHAIATAAAAGVSGGAELMVAAAVPTTIAVTPETAMLAALGQNVQLSAEVLDQIGRAMTDVSVSWSSSDPRVVAVDGAGLATAMGHGTATITATAGTVSATATVAVAQVVASVKVTPAAGTVVEADTLRLAAVAVDANGHAVNDAVFAWASNDTTVAVIDDSGLVTGVAPGHAMATATAAGVSGSAELVVAAAVPTAITVTPDTVMLAALGQTVQLLAEVLDQIGRVMADVSVSWSSSDARVVAVDGAGLATAMGHGTATIKAAAGDVWGTAEIMVEFSRPPPRYPIHVNYLDGFPADMKAGVESAAATWAEILWQTDTASYAFTSPKNLRGAQSIRFEADDVLRPGLHLWVGEDSDNPRGVGWAYYQHNLAANGTTPVGVFYLSRASHQNIHGNSAESWNDIVWSTAMHEIGHLLGIGTGQRWWASISVPDTTHLPHDTRSDARPFAYVTDTVAVSTFDRMGGVEFPEETPKVPVDGLRIHWGACIGVFNDVMRFGGSMDMVVTELTLSMLDPGWVGDLSHPLVARTLHKADWNDGPGSNNRSIHTCRDGLLYWGYPGTHPASSQP